MQMMQIGLSETYHKYTNPKLQLMSFEEFIRFCGDHDIFPSYTNKAQLFKIFQLLSQQYQLPQWTGQTSPSPKRRLSPSPLHTIEEYDKVSQAVKQVELIDEVAFIQALTLIAIMHEGHTAANGQDSIDDDEANARIDDEEDSGEEKRVFSEGIKRIIELMQRITSSFEQVIQRKNKQPGGVIKIEKMSIRHDIMQPFKEMYPKHFAEQEQKQLRRSNVLLN